MRIGVLCLGTVDDVAWAKRLGFQSMAWMRFAESPPMLAAEGEWRRAVDPFMHATRAADLRVSAIGAYYANPLDPRQTERARACWHRALQVAAYMGVSTVSGFSGGTIRTQVNERGGNPVYETAEASLRDLLDFWEPVAARASDLGVRVAFEHCPQAPLPLPVMGYNALATPAMWERFFDATRHENLGLEWDPSHLICQLIDPVLNLRQFGSRVFHVHAKDAWVDRPMLARYGIAHRGVAEHRLPGFGQADWAQIVHTLVRVGYDSDLNIEGRHDPVFRDHPAAATTVAAGERPILAGQRLEEAGLKVARRTLAAWVDPA